MGCRSLSIIASATEVIVVDLCRCSVEISSALHKNLGEKRKKEGRERRENILRNSTYVGIEDLSLSRTFCEEVTYSLPPRNM
jgi:hypothetical protein